MSKRLRIFAGPNGSGKSSIISKILSTEVQNGVKIDFGIYVNIIQRKPKVDINN